MIPIGSDQKRRGSEILDLGLSVEMTILGLIESGWDLVCDQEVIHGDCDEREMTEHLRNGMRERLRVPRDAPASCGARWRQNITVARGTEVKPREGRSALSGLTDIAIYFHDVRVRSNYHDPHAVIECKRVLGNSSKSYRLYVREGIDRFVSGKYSADHAAGFMVGYLLEGCIRSAMRVLTGV